MAIRSPPRPRRHQPRPGGPGLLGPLLDADLLEASRAVLAASPFHGEVHRKVWARLRLGDTRTSRRRADAADVRA